MATLQHKQQFVLVNLCFLLTSWCSANAQSDQGSRHYTRDGVYVPPNPGDRDYKTFTYNNRRYGQYQPNYYYGRGEPLDPRRIGGVPPVDRYPYDPENSDEPILPGVLGGWREDLQGRQRQDSLQLERDVTVKTSYGDVQGFFVYLYDDPDPESLYRPGSTAYERRTARAATFLGIPYAIPPVGEGRFRPPRPHRGWQLLQATDFAPACPQPVQHTGRTKGVRDMDEDCLYLNVYTPDTGGVSQPFPVMFYIHGGEFSRGASNLFPGHIMAAFYKVVVVTINYRLGALGFLSTGDVNSPGNYGVLDQAMALRWVYDNVEFFNGDRRSITLFGPGAGAASAGLLMVAPQTRHMVSKVIAQSGSAVADWALISDKNRAQNTSRVFGQLVGCSIESSWKLVNCLRQGRSFYELGNAEFPPHVGLFPWAPVIEMNVSMPYYEGWHEKDWHFVDRTPEQYVRMREYNSGLRYFTGVTLQEASFFIYNNDSLKPYYEIDEKFFDQKIKELVLRYNYTLNPEGIYEAIKYMYTYWPDRHNKTHIREQYINMLSDFLYIAPTDKMVKMLLDNGVPVFQYVLNTTVEAFRLPLWRQTPHDTELYLLAGAPFMDVEFFPPRLNFKRDMWTGNDRNMSHFFMKAYTDFARHGTPSQTQILGMHFEPSRPGMQKYLNLNTTYNSSIMWNYRQMESAFWSQYLPTVIGRYVVTYPPVTEYWWEPREPLQIAFWSMSAACLLLVVLVVVCCMLWRNAKRKATDRKNFLIKSDRYYSGDIFMVHENADNDAGIENQTRENVYEYRDTPVSKKVSGSTSSLRTSSATSLKELSALTSTSPNGDPPRRSTPLSHRRAVATHLVRGVPQTDV